MKFDMVPAALLAVAVLSAPAPATAQDAAAGSALFRQRCQTCHSVKPGASASLGPNLAGVVGRKAASTGYAYSPALRKSALKWDKPTLDAFLAGPMKKVPGTKMPIGVPDAKQRADIIAYLATVK